MMKNLFIITVIILTVTACSTVKPATSAGNASNNKSSITFIENISVTPGSSEAKAANPANSKDKEKSKISLDATPIENYSPLQFKYAILTNSSVEDMRNEKLLNFMDEWYGARYHYGGTTKDGIDC